MKRLLVCLAFAASLFSQTITQNSSATTTGEKPDVANMGFSPAIGWRLNFRYTGSTAATIQLDCAPDNGSGGAGTYAACTGAVDGTTNPVTVNSTPQAGTIALKVYTPHIAVNVVSLTGAGTLSWNLTGLFGASNAPTTVTTSGGGGGGNVNLTQVGGVNVALGQTTMSASLPVAIASDQSSVKVAGPVAAGSAQTGNPLPDGGNDGGGLARVLLTDTKGSVVTVPICDPTNANAAQALFNLSASGNTRIVTGTAAKLIRICHISFATAAGEDIKLVQGTGATCGASTADVTGLYKSIVALALDVSGTLTAGSGLDLCINQTGTQALGGIVIYTVF